MKASSYIAVAIGLCSLIALALPASAAAATVNVQTIQAIPPGGVSCPQLDVSSVLTTVTYDQLYSIDITVTDPSYVAVVGTVGGRAFGFDSVTRSGNPDGSMRQHIAITGAPVGTGLPITLSLLSAKTGQPVCLSVISFTVPGHASPVIPPPHVPTKPATTIPVIPSTPVATTSTTSTSTTSIVRGIGLGSSFDRICAENGSLQLWFLLITLYLIGAAVIALREPTVPERPLATTALLILVPFILLLGFWIFTTTCRGATWVPVVLFVIAIASLLVALWEKPPHVPEKMVELAPVPKKELLPEPPHTV